MFALIVSAILLTVCAQGCGSDDAGGDEASQAMATSQAHSAQTEAAIAHYQGYLLKRSTALVNGVDALLTELEAKDRVGARSRYSLARRRYGQIKPIAFLFPQLDERLDNHPSAYLRGDLTGFHRVERTLWTDNPPTDAVVYARKLLANVQELRARISRTDVDLVQIINLTKQTADKVNSVGLIGTEEPFAKIDLVDVAANVEGMRAASEAIETALGSESELSQQIDSRLDLVEARLDRLRSPSGFPKFEDLPYVQLIGINRPVEALKPLLSEARKQLEGQGA